jgi:hypothetical protein
MRIHNPISVQGMNSLIAAEGAMAAKRAAEVRKKLLRVATAPQVAWKTAETALLDRWLDLDEATSDKRDP